MVGFSLGGAVIFQLASKNPKKYSRILLNSPVSSRGYFKEEY
jgi:pimeloyl-ACP methyl ester carboxylesterase